MKIGANAHKDGAGYVRPFGLFYSGTRRPECVEICGRDAVACTQQEKEINKMSKKTNNKIKANTEVAETLEKAEIVPASIQAEPTHESHWWTVKDAIDAGVLGEDYAKFTGHYVRWDAQIARVELMEMLGLDIPNGVALSYAAGVKDKKAAEAARAEREEKIVNGGKDAYCNKASANAGKRFDKIADRVKARQGK